MYMCTCVRYIYLRQESIIIKIIINIKLITKMKLSCSHKLIVMIGSFDSLKDPKTVKLLILPGHFNNDLKIALVLHFNALYFNSVQCYR